MTKQITNYKELLEEKARLQALLDVQKQQIKEDWVGIKEDIRPSLMIVSTVKKIFSRKAGGAAATLGINLLVDGLFKKVLLARTGWLTRWVIPFLVKNYASHLVDEPEKIFEKVKNFISKGIFSKNGKAEPAAGQETGIDTV